MSGPRVAMVTGGNKGIGYGIVRELCSQLGKEGTVYLGARNEKLGREAVKKLNDEGLQPHFIQIDINDRVSVEKARDLLVGQHGGLDILVNNAAIAYKQAATEPFAEQAENTVATNFTGTLNVCDAFFPVLRPHARVVNVSSSASNLNYLTNSAIKQRLVDPELTVDELKKIMEDFVSAAKRGSHGEVGFPSSAYAMSKIGVSALTRVQQRMLEQDKSREDIVVNAVHPGYIATDMSSYKGPKTIEEGADAPTFAALLPPGPSAPRGQFINEDRKILDWTKGF